MYLALKNDVIITLNVMGSVFKAFYRKNQNLFGIAFFYIQKYAYILSKKIIKKIRISIFFKFLFKNILVEFLRAKV